MLLLAVDTSGKNGSLALAECDSGGDCRIREVVPFADGTFSAQLVPAIASLLARHAIAKDRIGGFAVATGPGSFTGLRVGLAAVKALAEVLGKPIAAVSRLEAIAELSSGKGRILASLDAGRGEIFVGKYEIPACRAMPHVLSEELLSRERFWQIARGEFVVTPDSELAELARTRGLAVELVPAPRSDAIARLGWRKIKAGAKIAPDELEANYIRRSDAEIWFKR